MATGTGNLPFPGKVYNPFDILTAEELNEDVSNIESLADGTGLGDASVPTTAIQDGAVTPDKLATGLPIKVQGGQTSTWTSSGDGSSNNFTITFPNAFAGTPLFTAIAARANDNGNFTCKVISVSNTGAVVRLTQVGAGNWADTSVRWLAIELQS